MPTNRAAGGILVALLLADCAGGPFGDSTPATPTPAESMAGRWFLAAPNAPPCGMNFGATPGAQQGTVTPDGGCPGKFFMSRHWTLEQNVLVINDQDNKLLANLSYVGNRFEGQAADGMAVTLAR